jgi:hypothetical protein
VAHQQFQQLTFRTSIAERINDVCDADLSTPNQVRRDAFVTF